MGSVDCRVLHTIQNSIGLPRKEGARGEAAIIAGASRVAAFHLVFSQEGTGTAVQIGCLDAIIGHRKKAVALYIMTGA